VLKALRTPGNRPWLHLLVYVLLVSLVSALVFSTCAMPSSWRIVSTDAQAAGCPETAEPGHPQGHEGHVKAPDRDCSFKPCFDSQPGSAFGYKIEKPEIPVLLLCLIWVFGSLLQPAPSRRFPRLGSPPHGRRIPLIYRFCTLLN
jgi:hypothetical protein